MLLLASDSVKNKLLDIRMPTQCNTFQELVSTFRQHFWWLSNMHKVFLMLHVFYFISSGKFKSVTCVSHGNQFLLSSQIKGIRISDSSIGSLTCTRVPRVAACFLISGHNYSEYCMKHLHGYDNRVKFVLQARTFYGFKNIFLSLSSPSSENLTTSESSPFHHIPTW